MTGNSGLHATAGNTIFILIADFLGIEVECSYLALVQGAGVEANIFQIACEIKTIIF